MKECVQIKKEKNSHKAYGNALCKHDLKGVFFSAYTMSSDSETTTIIQQINEPRYVIEVKHMKSGSALVLAIHKLRVSGDDLSEVMTDLSDALGDYLTEMSDDQ